MDSTFKQIKHNCATIPETIPPTRKKESIFYKLKKLWFSLILVSPKNSKTLEYFTSECQIRNEKKRQYHSRSYFIIHPLSMLAALYDAFLSLFYFNAIFFKLADVAFLRKHLVGSGKDAFFISVINVMDVLSWVNLLFMCFVGVIIPKDKLVLIDFRGIIYYRLKSFLFWAELLSSIPKCIICNTTDACGYPVWIFLTGLRLFIICLYNRPIILLKQTLAYFKVNSSTVLVIAHLSYLVAFVTHVMACTGFAISRYYIRLTGKIPNNKWILHKDIYYEEMEKQYSYAFFKASAQFFGITIDEYQEDINLAESIVSVINYATGKMINFIMWVAILHVFLAKDLHNTKLQEVITQVKTWTEIKEFPEDLQKRLIDFYHFHYNSRLFSTRKVNKIIPESLRFKVKANLYRTLKESNIHILSKLSDDDIQNLGQHFVTEIYCPKDIIISSGIQGTAFYLLASGTVAIYSHSGREVCHLQDGAYFGELSLIADMKIHSSVVAIEMTKVYKISRKYFNKYLLSNPALYEIFMTEAKRRLHLLSLVEEDHRLKLFVEMYHGSNVNM